MAYIPYGYKIVNGKAVADPEQPAPSDEGGEGFLGGSDEKT
jgi:hypothetical protein